MQVNKAKARKWAKYKLGQLLACAEVTKAVRSGTLPPASEFGCTDCWRDATEYDHRDYNKVLDVSPVCRSCNLLRGSAIGLKTIKAKHKKRLESIYKKRVEYVEIIEQRRSDRMQVSYLPWRIENLKTRVEEMGEEIDEMTKCLAERKIRLKK